jgi:hypothetical protein
MSASSDTNTDIVHVLSASKEFSVHAEWLQQRVPRPTP